MPDDPLLTAAKALMVAVQDDEERHGGTISRNTLQLASLLRIQVDRAEKRGQTAPAVDPVRVAAAELVSQMCEIRSFEVEAGAAGDGPLVALIAALGSAMPPQLAEWLKEGETDVPCVVCGEWHPEGVMEGDHCPNCVDQLEDDVEAEEAAP